MSCRILAFVFSVAGVLAQPGLAQEPTRSFDDLLAALEGASEEERVEAAETLAELGKKGKDAVASLVKTLEDKSPNARAAAAVALGHIGIDDDAAIGALLQRLEDTQLRSDDMPVWIFAAQALGQLGPKSVPRLIDKLSGDNRTGRRAAAVALHDIKPPPKQAMPALTALLVEDEPETRIAAMYAIIAIDPKAAASAIPSLHAMLDSDDFHTQYWACRTIAAIGPPDALETVPKLIELTTTGVASVRANAADAIGNIGPAVGRRAVAPLTETLGDPTYNVRRAGAIALGRLGKLAAPSVPAVERAMRDSTRSIRAEAAAALWQITGQADPSLPVLLEVLQDRNGPWEAALAFERLGAAGKPAVAELRKIVESTTGETQYFAVMSLAGIGPAAKEAIPTLEPLLESADEDMRQVAERVIKQLQGE